MCVLRYHKPTNLLIERTSIRFVSFIRVVQLKQNETITLITIKPLP